jgi:UDP-N-acetylglucosamine 2-epimerase (non-hydrolysing)
VSAAPHVAVVLGTRPEIIKMAPVLAELERRDCPVTLVHTGQHYSEELDAVFFDQLSVRAPDHQLGVGSASHGEQTAAILEGVEDVLEAESPDVVLVHGDTNSTLGGALATAKLDPMLGHVEAGLRSYDRSMPEEVNRILTDHAAEFLFAPTEDAAAELAREGLDGRSYVTGNTIVDSVYAFRDLAAEHSTILEEFGLEPGGFDLLTAHRAENTDDHERFAGLLDGVGAWAERSGRPVVYPIHPRAETVLDAAGIDVPDEVRLVEPTDFLDFLRLESEAALVFTDSGGVQEETCILGTPCVTLRYNTERPETAFVGANCIAGVTAGEILEGAEAMDGKEGDWEVPFGDGKAAERIVEILMEAFE